MSFGHHVKRYVSQETETSLRCKYSWMGCYGVSTSKGLLNFQRSVMPSWGGRGVSAAPKIACSWKGRRYNPYQSTGRMFSKSSVKYRPQNTKRNKFLYLFVFTTNTNFSHLFNSYGDEIELQTDASSLDAEEAKFYKWQSIIWSGISNTDLMYQIA